MNKVFVVLSLCFRQGPVARRVENRNTRWSVARALDRTSRHAPLDIMNWYQESVRTVTVFLTDQVMWGKRKCQKKLIKLVPSEQVNDELLFV